MAFTLHPLGKGKVESRKDKLSWAGKFRLSLSSLLFPIVTCALQGFVNAAIKFFKENFPLHLLLHLLPWLPTYVCWEKAMWKVSRRSSLGRVRFSRNSALVFFLILMANWVDVFSPLPHRHMPYAFCQIRRYIFWSFRVHFRLHLPLWIPTYILREKS